MTVLIRCGWLLVRDRRFHCTVHRLGKVFLASRYKQELESYFATACVEKRTENTIVTLEGILKEVDRIKNDGFAVDSQEFHEDVRCLAAPVFDSRGQVVAAIGVTGPAIHFSQEKETEVGQLVVQSAHDLSVAMGYHA